MDVSHLVLEAPRLKSRTDFVIGGDVSITIMDGMLLCGPLTTVGLWEDMTEAR